MKPRVSSERVSAYLERRIDCLTGHTSRLAARAALFKGKAPAGRGGQSGDDRRGLLAPRERPRTTLFLISVGAPLKTLP